MKKEVYCLKRFERVVPADNTRLPGMHTLMGDLSDRARVNYFPNIEYICRDGQPLCLQLLLPYNMFPDGCGSRRIPLVVYVQGAAWGEQDVYRSIPQLTAIAKLGYVVASVKHRASTVAQFPAFLQDVKSAIRYLRANADKYGIDPDEVAIWGDSSGGHTALMVGVTGDFEEFKTEDNREFSDAVSAVVDFYGPTDAAQINNKPRNPAFTADKSNIPEDILFGGCVVDHPEIAQPGNPINYVTIDRKLPPFFIAHGDSDAMVPFNQSVLMVEKLQNCDQPVEFYKVCGADHGIFFWTEELLEKVARFLQGTLGR